MSSLLIYPEPHPTDMPAIRQRRKQTAFTTFTDVVNDGIRQDIPLAGDGRSPESSTGVWPGATNLCINGGFQTNTTGATALSSSISRVTSQFKFGSASCEVVTSNAVANEGVYETFAGTVARYAASAWVRGAGGGTVRMCIADNATGAVRQVGASVTLTSAWQKITLIATNLTVATYRCQVETDSQQSITFQVDGLQAELGLVVTPYIETNGGTATRTKSMLTCPVAPTGITVTQGWIAARFRSAWGDTNEPYGAATSPNVFSWARSGATPAQYLALSRAVVSDQWRIDLQGTALDHMEVTAALSPNDIVTLIGYWTTTSVGISLNGANFVINAARTGVMSAFDTVFRVGTVLYTPDDRAYNGDFFWVAAGTGTPSNADAAVIGALGNVGNQPSVFPASCKFYWQGLNTKALTAV